MPRVIVGGIQRNIAESQKLMNRYERNLRARMHLAKQDRKLTNVGIAEQVLLSRQTVDSIFKKPLKAKPENLFKVLYLIGTNLLGD